MPVLLAQSGRAYTHTHTHQTHQNKTAISNQHVVYQLNCPMHFISDADHLINR